MVSDGFKRDAICHKILISFSQCHWTAFKWHKVRKLDAYCTLHITQCTVWTIETLTFPVENISFQFCGFYLSFWCLFFFFLLFLLLLRFHYPFYYGVLRFAMCYVLYASRRMTIFGCSGVIVFDFFLSSNSNELFY